MEQNKLLKSLVKDYMIQLQELVEQGDEEVIAMQKNINNGICKFYLGKNSELVIHSLRI